MLHKIPLFTRILCALTALLCLCTCLCGGVYPTPESALPVVPEDGGAGEWHLCLTVPDPQTPGLILALEGQLPPDADPAALAAVRMTVELPVAWRVTAAERTRDVSDSLTVTISAEGARAVILVDGELKDLVGIEFLITFEMRDPAAESMDSPRVTAHSEGVTYYDVTRQSVVDIPVTGAMTDGAVWGEEGNTAPEDTSPLEDAATGEAIAVPTPVPAAAVLIGCQETPCTDATAGSTAGGTFSVRFIYKVPSNAAGWGTTPAAAVVCLVGRGVITAELTTAPAVTSWEDGRPTVTVADTAGDGAYFLLINFRGLSSRGAWVFEAERGDGQRVRIHWQDGQFRGVKNG